MIKHEFDRLSEKYKSGQCSPDEISLLEEWAELHLKQQDGMEEDEADLSRTEIFLWERIMVSAGLTKVNKQPLRWIKLATGIAASLIILFITAWVLLPDKIINTTAEATIVGVETKNTGTSQQLVYLADGSTVLLEPGASVITSENYGKHTRTVRLEGEAFFKIKSNPKMPFLVFTGDLITEVLGTSFRIKPRTGQKTIEVSVVTGKVSVYSGATGSRKKKDGVIITPNQKVVYDTELKIIRQGLVDVPLIVVPALRKVEFSFDESLVDSVFSQIRRRYGVEIVVGNQGINKCVFTGDLSGLDLYSQLDFICAAINADYETRGSTIFITGSGCNGAQ